jgi:hypothetical protein
VIPAYYQHSRPSPRQCNGSRLSDARGRASNHDGFAVQVCHYALLELKDVANPMAFGLISVGQNPLSDCNTIIHPRSDGRSRRYGYQDEDQFDRLWIVAFPRSLEHTTIR